MSSRIGIGILIERVPYASRILRTWSGGQSGLMHPFFFVFQFSQTAQSHQWA